jgi:predicted nucleotide-binding protein
MAAISPRLFEQLKQKLKLSSAQVYKRIDKKARSSFLPRHLAAIALAAESGINIQKYASPDELAELRGQSRQDLPSIQVPVEAEKTRVVTKGKRATKRKPTKRRGNSVFVVHGRNEELRKSLFSFLRAVNLNPIEWRKAIQLTGKPSPYVSEILDAAFREAVAVIVLLSPDDEAKLRKEFVKTSDPRFEKQLTGQARPNVLFEAGMAFGRNPDSTLLVQVGEVRPFSDIAGRHVMHLNDSPQSRQEFLTKLANAGCNVDSSGSDWLTDGTFSLSQVINRVKE